MSGPPCRLASLGVCCSLGRTREEIWPRLVAGDPSGLVPRDDLIPGESRRFGAVGGALPPIPPDLAAFDCRNNALALAAIDSLRSDVAEHRDRVGAHRIGVVVGTSTGGMSDAEWAFRERPAGSASLKDFAVSQLEFGGLPEFVARTLGVTGPAYSLSTACSTGAKALASARGLLELGVCDAVVAGAVDTLCRLTANGFFALGAIAGARSNPMSRNRDGLNLGEGAALFLLTRERGGVQLLGCGESNDAHHMSAPDPEGRGAEEAMRMALADAGIAPSGVAYLNLHGTGTPHNDAMESRATARVFGSDVVCSSTKPLVGHTLGAAGALEVAFCWMMLIDGGSALTPPPHCWDGEPDPELPPLALAKVGERLGRDDAIAMSSSFGFGGSNSALVIGAEPR